MNGTAASLPLAAVSVTLGKTGVTERMEELQDETVLSRNEVQRLQSTITKFLGWPRCQW